MARPINTPSGNVFFDQTDVSIPGIQGISFTRSYNSKDAAYVVPSDLGRGWSHSFGRSLSFPDAISIDFRGDDAVAIYYQDLNGDQSYEAVLPSTLKSRIVQSGETYTRHFADGSYETYDAAGRLNSVVDVAGNVTTLARDASGRLESITDAGGGRSRSATTARAGLRHSRPAGRRSRHTYTTPRASSTPFDTRMAEASSSSPTSRVKSFAWKTWQGA